MNDVLFHETLDECRASISNAFQYFQSVGGGLNQWGRVKRKDHHLLQKNLVVTFIDFSSLICYRTHTILDIA